MISETLLVVEQSMNTLNLMKVSTDNRSDRPQVSNKTDKKVNHVSGTTITLECPGVECVVA